MRTVGSPFLTLVLASALVIGLSAGEVSAQQLAPEADEQVVAPNAAEPKGSDPKVVPPRAYESGSVIVTAATAEVREGPSPRAEVLTIVERGDIFEKRGRTGGWYYIVLGYSPSGWISGRQIRRYRPSARTAPYVGPSYDWYYPSYPRLSLTAIRTTGETPSSAGTALLNGGLGTWSGPTERRLVSPAPGENRCPGKTLPRFQLVPVPRSSRQVRVRSRWSSPAVVVTATVRLIVVVIPVPPEEGVSPVVRIAVVIAWGRTEVPVVEVPTTAPSSRMADSDGSGRPLIQPKTSPRT